MPILPDIGSRWYISGHHWVVVAHAEKEGEPAVRVRLLKGPKRGRIEFVWIWRLCIKGRGSAIPSAAA